MKPDRLPFALLLASALSLSACVVAPVDPGHAYQAPPPVPVEYPGLPPYPGYLWIDGYWGWGGVSYQWIPGGWVAPRPGQVWVPRVWHHEGERWRPEGGRWEARPEGIHRHGGLPQRGDARTPGPDAGRPGKAPDRPWRGDDRR